MACRPALCLSLAVCLAALRMRRELLDLCRHYFGPHGVAANHDGLHGDSVWRDGQVDGTQRLCRKSDLSFCRGRDESEQCGCGGMGSMFFKSSNGWSMKNASVQKIRCRRNGQGGMGGMDTHRRGGMDRRNRRNGHALQGGMDTHRNTNDSGRNGHASQSQRFRMDRSVIHP
jgi:hypothetical protein